HSMSGKGAIACNHRLSAGLFGRYSRIANDLVAGSDCVIVVGCKLGEVATKRYALFSPGARVIQIDSVAEEIGRTLDVALGLWGDAAETLDALADALSEDAAAARAARRGRIEDMHARMAQWRV